MTHPYRHIDATQKWKSSVFSNDEEIEFDSGKKFEFQKNTKFATMGSCFAQHFSKRLQERGGNLLHSETAHPLLSATSRLSYETYPARYGNVYTNRQFTELIAQAVGTQDPVGDFALRDDGKYGDLLRPGATPDGFSSWNEAMIDRSHHLSCVKKLLTETDVLVFTMGLTEAWVNKLDGHTYPVCPGTALGRFDPDLYEFRNFTYEDCIADLDRAVKLLTELNPGIKLLLTVSPVSLVASIEKRHVLLSTIASKSILRAAANEAQRIHPNVDYFPSYEIITGPQSKGKYWQPDLREVTSAGVDLVMRVFFDSRMPELSDNTHEKTDSATVLGNPLDEKLEKQDPVEDIAAAECEEILLDRD